MVFRHIMITVYGPIKSDRDTHSPPNQTLVDACLPTKVYTTLGGIPFVSKSPTTPMRCLCRFLWLSPWDWTIRGMNTHWCTCTSWMSLYTNCRGSYIKEKVTFLSWFLVLDWLPLKVLFMHHRPCIKSNWVKYVNEMTWVISYSEIINIDIGMIEETRSGACEWPKK